MLYKTFTLASIVVTTFGESPLYNGKCDEEFCACTLAFEEDTEGVCPDWMFRESSSPYQGHSSTSCSTAITCMSYSKNFFQNFPVTATASSKKETPCILSYKVNDGRGDGAPIFVNYNRINPAPECPKFPPYTNSPSGVPSESFAPSIIPTKTTSSDASTLLTDSFGLFMLSFWTAFVLSGF